MTLEVYRQTQLFPNEERFGLMSQMRRCAVSVPSNIVEGAARDTQADFLRFLGIAYGSLCELEYQITLAKRLGYLKENDTETLATKCEETARVLNGLINSLKNKT